MSPRLLAAALPLLATLGCAEMTAMTMSDKPLAKPIAYRVAYQPYPSGMRLVVHEDAQAPRVTMNVSYRVGATDEPSGKEGLAHLAEHLTFLARHGGAQSPRVWSRLLASGAQFNAFTTHDSTDYWFTAPPEQFARLAALEAQRMREPLAGLTEEDFRVERDVVVAELRERQETSPEGAQYAWALTELLPGHPYGRTVGGTPESVLRLTLEDVRAFVKQHYTPAHAVVVVSGPLSSADVKYEVADRFSSLTGNGATAQTPPVQRTPPPMPGELKLPGNQRMLVKRGPVEHPRLWMMWPMPGLHSGQIPQLHATASLMRASLSSYLAQEDGVVRFAVFPQVMDGMALLVAMVELTKQEDAQRVAERILDGRSSGNGRTWSLPSARNALFTEAFLELEQLPTSDMARYLRATGQPDYVGGWQQQLNLGLAESSFSKYLWDHFQRERVRMMLVVPEAPGAGRTVVGQGFSRLPGAEDFGRWDVPLPEGTHDVRRVARPPGLGEAGVFSLSNGLEVVVLRRGSMPMVEAHLVLHLPGLHTPLLPEVALHASWASMDSSHLHAAKVGARTYRNVLDHQARVSATAASGNLPQVLDDLRQWLRDSDVDAQVWWRSQEGYLRGLERASQRTDQRARRVLEAKLFSGHPYGNAPTVEQARALTPEQLSQWIDTELRPGNMTLYLVGDLPPAAEAQSLAESILGGWRGGKGVSKAAPPREPPLPTARSVVLMDRPGASQADMRIGLRWPLLDAGQVATADVLTELLQERLRHQLRERLGLTYGIQAQRDERPLATALRLHTAVDAKTAAGALEQLLAELGSLEDTPLPASVVERARWQVARDYDLRFRTNASVATHLMDLTRMGRSLSYWEKYPEHLAAVTPASLQALVQQLSLGREVVVITGDAASLRPQLEAAGFQVEVLAPAASVARAP
ncbi:zinc protease [Archangium gephyra]|uniref:Peptidase M16-like protein n=1 Tax=Archangium gephyra TaxID=48 RepID=A0AAC8Q1D0_9BACT|nr:M16 family metallopeptidase [Archangium gephyra]AKI99152.1 Peptidase M16-like protein [Archangium gephyra]REG31059.1 zinc protease [Archangium gephyra]